MAGGPPVLQVGAQGALGWAKQSAFGTPVVTPSNAKNWATFTAMDLSFDAGQHAIKVGANKRATEQLAGRGLSRTQNGFTLPLQPTAGAMLLACFFGADSYGTGAHTITPGTPQLLTVEKIIGGQSLQYQDVLLDNLDIAQSGAEWTAKYGVMGGVGDTQIASGTPTLPTDANVFNWGQTSLSSAWGSITAAELGGLTLAFKNGVRQFAGAGSYAPTRAAAGEFTAGGTITYLFDSAAAAAAQAAYIAGTTSTLNVSIVVDGTHNIVFNLPTCLLTANRPQVALADLVSVQCTFSVLKPQNITVTVENDDAAAYLP